VNQRPRPGGSRPLTRRRGDGDALTGHLGEGSVAVARLQLDRRRGIGDDLGAVPESTESMAVALTHTSVATPTTTVSVDAEVAKDPVEFGRLVVVGGRGRAP
jgi:hypothetical protein